MINEAIGTADRIGQTDVRRTSLGEVGHAIYGPYAPTRPGRYRLTFRLALHGEAPSIGDQPCAQIEVTAAFGAAVLAHRPLAAGDLAHDLRAVQLDFSLHEYRTLEFRVAVFGLAELLIDPTFSIERLGEAPALPPAQPQEFTTDPVEIHRQIRSVLRLLQPRAAKDHRKIRLGHVGDGGYICIDDFAGIDTALSFGINDDISWDLDAADRGLTVYQFDHTVDDPAPNDPRMVFEKKMIDVSSGPDRQSLADLIARHDKRNARPNIVLKMDIECAEWEVLRSTPAEALGRIAWIVCELHYFQGLAEPSFRSMLDQVLGKLAWVFGVVHVHGNSGAGFSNVANVLFPNVLEATFVNRDLYTLVDTNELFPGPLDVSCDPNQPDIYLGSFRF